MKTTNSIKRIIEVSEPDDLDDDDDDDDDSVDFEEQLKKDCMGMVSQKLDEFENRLKYLFDNHNISCKSEFKMYETHIKEQVLKMTAYV